MRTSPSSGNPRLFANGLRGLLLASAILAAPSASAFDPLAGATKIFAGYRHACAIVEGGLRCWGDNFDGQLGDNNAPNNSSTAVSVTGLASGVTDVSASRYDHTCAVVNGGAKCWGLNDYGQLGNDSLTPSPVPVDVLGLTSGVTAVATGYAHACALTTGGAVKCWGANWSGQLGNNDYGVDSDVPVQVTGLTSGVTAITAADSHTCAIVSGAAMCWGNNFYGELGNNDPTVDSAIPVQVSTLTSDVTAIAGGWGSTCAIHGGAAKCWGANSGGSLGNGNATPSPVPLTVSGLTSGVTSITVGSAHGCAVLSPGGGAKCWGYNFNGQLGDSTTTDHLTPGDVTGLTSGVAAVSAGEYFSCALLTGGGVKCWGMNASGQVGDNSTAQRNAPVDVLTFALDQDPDAFSFTSQSSVTLNSQRTSNSITPTGYQSGDISVTNGEYAIGCGAGTYTTDPGTITLGQSVCVRHTSSSLPATPTTTTLTIGTTSGTFTSTTTSVIAYNVVLEGAQEVPVNGSPATGSGTVTVDVAANTIAANVTYSGLTSAITGAHFHGPAARGVGAGVKIGLTAGPTSIVQTVPYLEADEAAILAGNWYINVHTSTFPGGEIRAQVDNVGAAPRHLLTVNKAGTGSGTVTSASAGPVNNQINCGATCTYSSPVGLALTLTATAAEGSVFAGWSGGGCTGTGTCVVTMSAAQTVTATFNPTPPIVFNLVLEGAQEVPVNGSPATGSGTVTVDIAANTLAINVTYSGLTSAITGAHFHGPAARGVGAGVKIGLTAGPTSIVQTVPYLEADQAAILAGNWYVNVHTSTYPGGEIRGQVDAIGAAPRQTLTVSKPGTGTGTITSAVLEPGINCGATCSHSYPQGLVVNLTATPAGGSTFVGWSGGGCSGTGACAVTMSGPQTVMATFNLTGGTAPHSGFNGDARSDVLWRNTSTGQVYQWQMNGFALSGQGYMMSVPTNWMVAGVGDASGDGGADVLWREASGLNYLWIVSGLGISSQGYLPSVPNPWIVTGLGDASGDGKADVFWRNATTGQNYLWVMNGLSITSQGYLPTVSGSDWEVVGVADYSGDGKADALWRNKATGQNYLWVMNGLAVASQGYLPSVADTNWEAVGSPDANGDGKADVLWRHKVTGQNYLWTMNGFTVASQGYMPSVADANWKVVGFGDYNGDGRGDVLWRNASTGQNYLWIVNGLTVTSQGYLPSVSGAAWQPVKR